MSDNPRLSPVVAIDMDGVLRVARPDAGEAPAEGVYGKRVTVRREHYPLYLHREPDWDERGRWIRVHWFSGIGADWVRSLLHRGTPVVWATTWRAAANRYLARPLGLPELPVATVDEGPDHWPPSFWKAAELGPQFPGRPLLWVDDWVSSEALEILEGDRRPLHPSLTHWHAVIGEAGVTEDDVARMDEWLSLASTPAGHKTLRRRREQRDASRRQAIFKRRGIVHDDVWFQIHRRLLVAIGPGSIITEMLADLAVTHPNGVDPADVERLLTEWPPAHMIPTATLLDLLRLPSEPQSLWRAFSR